MFSNVEDNIYDSLMSDSSVTSDQNIKQQIVLVIKSNNDDLPNLNYDILKEHFSEFNKISSWYVEKLFSQSRDRNIELVETINRAEKIFHNIKYAKLQIDKLDDSSDDDDMDILSSEIEIGSSVTIDSTFKGLTIKSDEKVLDIHEHSITISLNMKQLTSLYQYSSIVFLKVNKTGDMFKGFIESIDVKNRSAKLVNIHKYKYHSRKYFRVEEHNLKIKINDNKAISVDLSVDGIGVVTKDIGYRIGDSIKVAIDDPKISFHDTGVIKNIRALKDKYLFLGIDLMLSHENAELLKEFVFNYKQIQIIKEFKDKYSELERELK
jgi:hypothetical protein